MKHFVTWSKAEVEAARELALQGMSSSVIAETMAKQGFRTFTTKAVLGKLRRMSLEGVIPPRPASPPVRRPPGVPAKGDSRAERRAKARADRSAKPAKITKASKRFSACEHASPRKRTTTAGRQRQSILGVMANSAYQPAPVIAGFPTIQVRKDREGNRIAPVTLRRIDFGGAHA